MVPVMRLHGGMWRGATRCSGAGKRGSSAGMRSLCLGVKENEEAISRVCTTSTQDHHNMQATSNNSNQQPTTEAIIKNQDTSGAK